MRREPQFHPMPTKHKRSTLRWILLALHTAPFTTLIFAFPSLQERYPEILNNNLVILAIPFWAGLLILHLLLVCVLEIHENSVYERRERERRQAFQQARRDTQDTRPFVPWTPPERR